MERWSATALVCFVCLRWTGHELSQPSATRVRRLVHVLLRLCRDSTCMGGLIGSTWPGSGNSFVSEVGLAFVDSTFWGIAALRAWPVRSSLVGPPFLSRSAVPWVG